MRTIKTILIIGVTALVSVAGTLVVCRLLQDAPDEVGPNIGSVQSTVLNESRDYFVHLPEGYDRNTNARYPVLYVLDGAMQSNHTAESASLLARVGIIPPIIVVGVPNVNGSTRDRDLTPPDNWLVSNGENGARRFLTFFEKELIPKIEADYRTTHPRMLSGWSLGGLFVLYSQIANPSLFDARFAHSPHIWGNSDPTITRIEQGMKAITPPAGYLYLSLGDQEAKEMMDPFKRTLSILERHASPSFGLRADFSVGGGHNSNPRLSTPVGLCAMFTPGAGHACRSVQK